MIKFLIDDLHVKAALKATTEGMPIENTQNSYRARPWRSAGLSDEIITGAFSAPKRADLLVIARHNFSPSAKLKLVLKKKDEEVYASDTALFGTITPLGTFRAGIDPWGGTFAEGHDHSTYSLTFPVAELDSYEIRISNSGGRGGYLEIGRIMLGKSWSPSNTFSRGNRLQLIDGVTHRRTAGMSLRSEGTGEAYRVLSINLDWLKDNDKTVLIEEMGRVSRGGEMFVSAYPDNTGQTGREYQMICKRITNIDLRHTLPRYWDQKLTLEEV